MTDFKATDQDVSRAIRSWLHEDRHEDASRIAGAVLDHVEATPRRRATWWPARRFPTMNKFLAIGLGAAAVVVAVFVGAQLFGSADGGTGGQSTPTATAEPTPEPTATPEASPSDAAGLPEGPFLLVAGTDGAVPITLTIAAPHWEGETGAVLCWGNPSSDCSGPPDGAGMIVYPGLDSEFYVYGDACNWAETRPDTPATTVDELMAALANQVGRDPSGAEDITLDGYTGKKIILGMADDVDIDACEDNFALFGVPGDDLARYSQSQDQIDEVWAVDVDGQIVILVGAYYPDTEPNVVDELQAMLASATFEAP